MEPDIVLVRSTAHLPDGIFPGEFYWVDRNRSYVADAIDAQILVIENGDDDPSLDEPEADDGS